MSKLHFRVRHGPAMHRHKNRAAKIFVVCEQKPYPVSLLHSPFLVSSRSVRPLRDDTKNGCVADHYPV